MRRAVARSSGLRWRDELETGYRRFPMAAARLYDFLTSGRANLVMFRQIARDLCEVVGPTGRLLDVGSGPGRLLSEIHRANPSLELHGLDVSPAMMELARRNLVGVPASLSLGSIARTTYGDASFDLITCTGSFYTWRDPERCLDEIHRLLRPGRAAVLFETDREYRRSAYLRGLVSIFPEQGPLRGTLSPMFLTQQLRMTYEESDLRVLVRRSAFGEATSIRQIELGGLPIWLRIELHKADAEAGG